MGTGLSQLTSGRDAEPGRLFAGRAVLIGPLAIDCHRESGDCDAGAGGHAGQVDEP